MARKIKLHGMIELTVPDGMGEYEAWQLLETLLDGGEDSESADLGKDAYVTDYCLGRSVSDNHEQKTSYYSEWIKEVTSEPMGA